MMGWRRTVWVIVLVVVACAVAIRVLPARWVMAWIPETSPVIVTDASGTLWSASATVAVGAGGLRRTLPDPLRWHLVFDGGPVLDLTHPWLGGPLTLSLSWQGLRLSGQSLQLPAFALTTAHAMFNTLDPGGDVLVDWPELVLGPAGLSSDDGGRLLSVRWRNASSSLTRVQPLGDYTLTVRSGIDRGVVLALTTREGPLVMQGEGTVLPSGRAHFDGQAWVDASASGDTHAALTGLLNAMGPRSGPDGHIMMNVR
ncbi:MAG: type II secretion system protein N [Alcaligenaceae bacterium]|nr:type II secretion system protein N [Alcaligenaceae bacterium]